MIAPVHAIENADPMLLPPRDAPYVLKDVLEKRVHGSRDEVILDLGDCYLRIRAEPAYDTIASEFTAQRHRPKKGYVSVSASQPWSRYVGKECGWTWLALNQQGYLDTMLIGFDGIEPNILLQTMASSIELFVVSPIQDRRSRVESEKTSRPIRAKHPKSLNKD